MTEEVVTSCRPSVEYSKVVPVDRLVVLFEYIAATRAEIIGQYAGYPPTHHLFFVEIHSGIAQEKERLA